MFAMYLIQCNAIYFISTDCKLAPLLAADKMRRPAGCAGQACQTMMQIVSCPRCKRTRMDRLRRQDASARWRCPKCVASSSPAPPQRAASSPATASRIVAGYGEDLSMASEYGPRRSPSLPPSLYPAYYFVLPCQLSSPTTSNGPAHTRVRLCGAGHGPTWSAYRVCRRETIGCTRLVPKRNHYPILCEAMHNGATLLYLRHVGSAPATLVKG
jgi:ribosomal protein L37AE/L43A